MTNGLTDPRTIENIDGEISDPERTFACNELIAPAGSLEDSEIEGVTATLLPPFQDTDIMRPHQAAFIAILGISFLCNRPVEAGAVVTFQSAPTTVGHGGNSSTTMGWAFTADRSVLVTALGYFDFGSDGLLEPHQVGIFDGAGRLVVSAVVPAGTSGDLVSGFRYVSIAPISLAAGGYTIGGTIGAQASDRAAYNASGLTTVPGITIPSIGNRYTEAGSYTSLTYPNISYSNFNGYFGPNFQISAVPEPSTLMTGGFAGLVGLIMAARRRSRA